MAIRWLTAFLDFPVASFEGARAFWVGVTGYRLSPPRGPRGDFATLVPGGGDAFLRVQRIYDGPPRCHLDVHADDVDETAHRAASLGARTMFREPGLVVFDSPGGLAWCVVRHEGEKHRPPPWRWPGGHRSLADQLCLDIPADVHDTECAFWASLTGWERRPGSQPEFSHLVRPGGMPLRLLLQRTGDEPGHPVRAHLDLACDDITAERRRHESLGAVPIRAMPGWTTMRDPAGLEYCITRRDPDTGA